MGAPDAGRCAAGGTGQDWRLAGLDQTDRVGRLLWLSQAQEQGRLDHHRGRWHHQERQRHARAGAGDAAAGIVAEEPAERHRS